MAGGVGWLEKWGSKLTSAKVEVEVEAELAKKCVLNLYLFSNFSPYIKDINLFVMPQNNEREFILFCRLTAASNDGE